MDGQIKATTIGAAWGLFGTLLGLHLGLHGARPELGLFEPGRLVLIAPLYAILAVVIGRGMLLSWQNRSESFPRYTLTLSLAMIVYMVSNALFMHAFRDVSFVPARIAMALVPVAALIWAYRAYRRYAEALDELERLIEFRALSFATLVVTASTVAAAFLQAWGLLPPWGLMLVVPELILCWIIGRGLAQRHYYGEQARARPADHVGEGVG